ncbi:hypothetical protein [Sphingomonas sp. LY160]|uniref:hypothetical protein n=1 Tax=Sphingomonas sp. LY160 TaxID=3095342 RepID=UPI002ADEDD97|nr:hypothetical protein [Sphingomonas sp. LY160]MEA1071641.1 hypothetical protein [Sphingomonas sp. LY160]
MSDAFDRIWSAAAGVIGIAVFLAVMWAVARTYSVMWQRVSRPYRRVRKTGTGTTKLETIVVAQRGTLRPFNAQARQYAGTLLSVSNSGLSLSLIPIPPLNLFAPPIFLPFDEMTLVGTSWALWPEPFAIRMKRLPNVDIILARDTVSWIRAQTQQPPFGWDV